MPNELKIKNGLIIDSLVQNTVPSTQILVRNTSTNVVEYISFNTNRNFVTVASAGTTNTIPKFDGTGTGLTDSGIIDNGTTVTIARPTQLNSTLLTSGVATFNSTIKQGYTDIYTGFTRQEGDYITGGQTFTILIDRIDSTKYIGAIIEYKLETRYAATDKSYASRFGTLRITWDSRSPGDFDRVTLIDQNQPVYYATDKVGSLTNTTDSFSDWVRFFAFIDGGNVYIKLAGKAPNTNIKLDLFTQFKLLKNVTT